MLDKKFHGYSDPSLQTLDPDSLVQLNKQAARDLAKRSISGGLIVLLALLISANYSPIIHDAPIFTYLLIGLMTVIFFSRLYLVFLLLKRHYPIDKWLRYTFIIFFLSSASWGSYVAVCLYLYQTLFTNMIILMFTIGIAAGALSSLFIWKRLAQMYLCMVFLPIIVSTMLKWELGTVSILFGLISYMTFLLVQANRANAEYWQSLYLTKILQQQTTELVNAKDQAEKANRAKTDFFIKYEPRTQNTT